MFREKVVVVTGATSGIGRETAILFAQEGATVVAAGRDESRLLQLARSVDLTLHMDVTDAASVEMASATVLDRFGGVDIVVNNAGIGLFKPVEETSEAELQQVMEVNFFGAVRVAQAFLPSLKARNGVLVQVASVAGKRGYAKHTAYCASKHALIGWSEALRNDLKGTGASVVVVCPPAVATPFFENAGYHTFKEDHPKLTPMSAEQVARDIVAATARRDRTAILTPRARILNTLHVLAPGMLEVIQRFK